jgi:hypothetical protein
MEGGMEYTEGYEGYGSKSEREGFEDSTLA